MARPVRQFRIAFSQQNVKRDLTTLGILVPFCCLLFAVCSLLFKKCSAEQYSLQCSTLVFQHGGSRVAVSTLLLRQHLMILDQFMQLGEVGILCVFRPRRRRGRFHHVRVLQQRPHNEGVKPVLGIGIIQAHFA